MAAVTVIPKSALNFLAWGDGPGTALIARTVTAEMCPAVGGGIGKFDGCSVEWTLLYDEMIYCLEGLFRLRVGAEVHEIGPGDTLLVLANTAVRYEGKAATVFYALSPNDWMKRYGMANPLLKS
jgi:ethanolamine utilization protein EutQ